MKLTKIDVAKAHLETAVRVYLEGGHPASVYLLAASAREILTTIGEKTGEQTFLRIMAESTGLDFKDLIRMVHAHAKFLKHANTDPAEVLDLPEKDVEITLYVACHDFERITKDTTIETQIYEEWFLTRHWKKVSEAPLRIQPLIRKLRRKFPSITNLTTEEARKLGWAKLQQDLADPALVRR